MRPFTNLQHVIAALVREIESKERVSIGTFRCFFDTPKSELTLLAQALSTLSPSERVLFLRGPDVADGLDPWRSLLAAVIREAKVGIATQLDGVVDALNADTGITGIRPTPLAPGRYVIDPAARLTKSADVANKWACQREWAALELHTARDHAPLFAQICGGLRPLIYIFDDYSSYIENEEGCFRPSPAAADLFTARYASGGSEPPSQDILQRFCEDLNDLTVLGEVRAPRLWVEDPADSPARGAASYGLVSQALPFDELDAARSRIAAFFVDLEWRPTIWRGYGSAQQLEVGNWSDMGYRAIHLLSLRYPEIPSFILTGEGDIAKLQDGIANGASWCFRKAVSHHPALPNALLSNVNHTDMLRYLRRAADTKYGAFSELPYPGQLEVDSASPIGKALAESFGLILPVGACARGQALLRLVARLFPDGSNVAITKVVSEGKSKAQAKLFAAISRQGRTQATRFLKFGPWQLMQAEALAYSDVIQPRLNSYVGRLVGDPALTTIEGSGETLGGIAYSLAGFPEAYRDLLALNDLLRKHRDDVDSEIIVGRIRQTLQEVLRPLYGVPRGASSTLPRARRPLWDWLGDVLPPLITGELASIAQPTASVPPEQRIESYLARGYQPTTAWLRASADLSRATWDLAERSGQAGLSCDPAKTRTESIEFCGFLLQEVDIVPGNTRGTVTLTHPDLGIRIRARGDVRDIAPRFSGPTVRLGMPANVIVDVDRSSWEITRLDELIKAEELAIFGAPATALDAFSKAAAIRLLNPLEHFCLEGVEPHYAIEAAEGPIHGDLNLQNILFAGEEKTGWLIDFERSRERGMIAFDLAKLEVEIWTHHLFGSLTELADVLALDPQQAFALLHSALRALDGTQDPFSVFRQGLIVVLPTGELQVELLTRIRNLLRAAAAVRRFATDDLKLSEAEQHWARAAYFFVAIKFLADRPLGPHRCFALSASAWYLTKVAPDRRSLLDAKARDLLISGGAQAIPQTVLDGIVLNAQRHHYSAGPGKGDSLNEFVMTVATPRKGRELIWPKAFADVERWDLASTGSIANITPIFGYLWLMVKASASLDIEGRYRCVVPKISSKGSSGGTIDILGAGGMIFPDMPETIIHQCRTQGGVFCAQNPELTPLDRVLMPRRKRINAMKSASLVYSSILSKKIAMGITRAIVDVKVGRDSKMLMPFPFPAADLPWADECKELLPEGKLERLKVLLQALDGGASQFDLPEDGDVASRWLTQRPCGTLGPLEEIRWFVSNCDVPQCRAVGRKLILFYLDCILGSNVRDASVRDSDPIVTGTECDPYSTLYRSLLPAICDVPPHLRGFEKLREQWLVLRSRLPTIEQVSSEIRNELVAVDRDCRFEEEQDLQVKAFNLKRVTFTLFPYNADVQRAKTGPRVERINAYALDELFDWLCGGDDDEAVGFWLHALPGQYLQKDREKAPFITVFYRPKRCKLDDVIRRVRRFLSTDVQVATTS